ncbi:unnamed protein product [Paramecium pentaurelia]|uniref:ubiquitinyl hydrolase 1 n=1 Tax=Paramecium pentaurelia TaxID=43138 RepID=A0A8S1XUV8_9CILI|nr:unnamed protein product [Paramecium pentaurelia]
MQSLPDQTLTRYVEMGYGEMNIRQCWERARGDLHLFEQFLFDGCSDVSEAILYQISQQDYFNNDEIFRSQNILEQIKNETLQMYQQSSRKIKLRTKDKYVGLLNIGNTCSINSVLQFCHQIPQLFKLLLECQNGKSQQYEKFVLEIQILFTQLIASNVEYVIPRDAIKSISWEPQEQEYIGAQQDIIEIFNLLLNKFDKSIRRLHMQNLMATDVLRVELFGNQKMNELFQIILMNDKNQREYHPNIVATLKHKNIRTFLSKDFSNKILELPKFLRISINRIIFSNRSIIKLQNEFIIEESLNLEMCVYNNNSPNQKEQINKLLKQSTDLQEEIQKIRLYLSSLNGVIQVYENEGIFIDLIFLLKKKQESIMNQLKQKEEIYKQNQLNINKLTSNRYQYRIHSIVIHFGSAQEGHNLIYIYNFFLEKWMKYNDISVQFVEENVVLHDSKIYGQLVTYVNQDMIPQLRSHQQFIQNIGNIVVAQPNKELQQIVEINNIPQNVLTFVTKQNQENYRNNQNY